MLTVLDVFNFLKAEKSEIAVWYIFRLEVVLQLEVQCRDISSFALTCFYKYYEKCAFIKNSIVYNGPNL